jgi:hypothetical protein
MAANDSAEAGSVIETRDDGTVVIAMPFARGKTAEQAFTRADLIFKGVGHRDLSYEVRVFLNNPGASAKTPRKPEDGYAGKFIVFGHGGCAGDEGHCDIHGAPTETTAAAVAVARPHPMTPLTQMITITERLQEILDRSEEGLRTITLVPIKVMPDKSEAGSAKGVFSYESVGLRTYR